MKKKLIITKSQYDRLKSINENNNHSNMVKSMKEFLDKSYEPVERFIHENGEYLEQPMVKIKLSEEIITPNALYEYMKFKFNMGEEFTKQVIRDWMYNQISDEYDLTKNVSMDK